MVNLSKLNFKVEFFCYLLIDPTQMPSIQPMIEVEVEIPFREFISAIFYVGKGKRSRPTQHLIDARKCRSHSTQSKATEVTSFPLN